MRNPITRASLGEPSTELSCATLRAFCDPPLRACSAGTSTPPEALAATEEPFLMSLMSQAHVLLLVPLLLLALRRIGVVKGLGGAEMCAIGILMHLPATFSPVVGVTLSVALNVTLILYLQEVQERNATPPMATASNGTRPSDAARSASPPSATSAQPTLDKPSPSSASGGNARRKAVSVPKLDAVEEQTLHTGAMVLKTIAAKKGNEGLAVQVVNTPAELVWATILDFGEWPRMVDDVVATQVYERSEDVIKVKVTIGIGFLKIHTYVVHVLDKVAGTLTWSIDEPCAGGARQSDLLANTGYWIVRPGAPNTASCTVFYSCAVQLRSWAPGWLDRYIAREGLPRALGWLKREAEKRYESAPQQRVSLSRSFSTPHLDSLDGESTYAGGATPPLKKGATMPAPQSPPAATTAGGAAATARNRPIWDGHGRAMKGTPGQNPAAARHRRVSSSFD